MRFLTILILLVSAPSLFGAARIAKANATTPTEAVNWTAGVPLSYDGSGNIVQIGEDRFTYDRVGRLVESKINGVNRTYHYDAFGNRTGCAHEPQSDCQFGVQIDSATNRTRGSQHDSRGNVKTFGGHTYTYDDTDMPRRDDGTRSREFIYTADDERIATYAIGGEWKWTLRDLGGKVLRELTSSGSTFTWQKDYVYRDGQLLASRHVVSETPVTYHYHLDHLGSPRRITDRNNRIVGFHDYFAFGPEVPGGLTEPMATSLKYTGHERDSEGGSIEGLSTLDYMHARYYSSAAARFLSVDRGDSERLGFPQTWNRYAYALNSPIKVFDPDGREWRKFADKIGITRTLEFLAARSPEIKATLDLHDGPNKPNLEFAKSKELGQLDDGSKMDEAGNFKAFGVKELTYDFSKLTGSGSEADLYPATGKYLATAKYEGGRITFDKSVNLNVNLGKLTKKDKETLRIIVHELGHANLAATNMLLYLQLTADDKTKGIPHDDREVEEDAINYQKRNCKYPDFCDQ